MSDTEILVVAGEASGDAHAADLVRELKARNPSLRFFGMGGPKLKAEGVELIHDAAEVSVMGITEVLPRIPRILKVMGDLRREAEVRRPKVAILVDIPDFNLRLAPKLKKLGVKVAYYVSPMIWAWRQGRVHHIAKYVDRMLCILPFEVPFYRGANVHAEFVGSPVLEQVPEPLSREEHCRALGVDPSKPTLAVLPGSRMGEIRRILPTLVETAKALAKERPGLQLLLPVAPSIRREEILSRFEGAGVTPLLFDGRAPEVVGASDVAVVASGTASLEAGLMLRPFVVVYRVSFITYLVGKLLLKVKHVALVNLLAGRRLVPELLQGEMTPVRIVAELRRLWTGKDRDEVVKGLADVRLQLGEPGAAKRAADSVLQLL